MVWRVDVGMSSGVLNAMPQVRYLIAQPLLSVHAVDAASCHLQR